jgi:RND family efflux transporter MFP subunit
MHQLFHKKRFHVGLATVLIVSMGLLLVRMFSHEEQPMVTAVAESGAVRQYVSVSGVAKAKEKADLSFPTSGVVKTVLVEVGDTVEAGEILAILESDSASNEHLAAMAGLRSAIADRGELIAGPTNTTRTVTNETVQLKKEALATTIDIELSKVKNARRALLSDGLTAYTDKTTEDATPPTVSGTYTCEKEGSYMVSIYPSRGASGYSYRLTGLEEGVFTASVDQPSVLGTCGLRILFDPDSTYTNSTWTIEIPNTKSSTYTLNKNAYDLAVIQSGSAIDLAKQELALAEAEAQNVNAAPRSEALVRADAAVEKAQATLSQIESELSDRIMRAPFSGTVTSLSIKPGETVRAEPVMTILTDRAFEITAKVPEIDVAKLTVGQPVELLFDAKDEEVQRGTLSFVSLQATEIDGVAYFDTYITLDQTPSWMRSGLNADIDIIVSETSEGLRIPKRFLVETDGVYTVLKAEGKTFATTTVEVLLRGSDGFVSLKGLNTGDVVVAP